jgi:hypothetical protein
MYWDRTLRKANDGHLAEITAYYAGDEARMMYPKEMPRLLEITHQHLFAMPLTWLIAAHLMMLSGQGVGVRWGLSGGGVLAVAAHLAAPWLVRYVGTGWSWLYAASGGLLAGTLVPMYGIALWEMWRPRRLEGKEA